MNPTFQITSTDRIERSQFELSFDHKFTADMGQIIPVCVKRCIPTDVFRLANSGVVRLAPMLAPLLHRVDAFYTWWFVPDRILWDEFEEFITGGDDGDEEIPIPTWIPSAGKYGESSLWDYMGFPAGVKPTGFYPMDFCRRGYARIWNEFFRQKDVDAEVAETNEDVLRVRWEKDYFMSALPYQQRGTAPALNVTGTTQAVWSGGTWAAVANAVNGFLVNNLAADAHADTGTGTAQSRANAIAVLNANSVNLGSSIGFTANDLRQTMQLQRFLEVSARVGSRYIELLKGIFRASPRDERLQRPEFIGGSRAPVIFSEVLQTGETGATSPQGNMAGHGISVAGESAGDYRVEEFGTLFCLFYVRPAPAYQQGVPREWYAETRYDFPFPQFAHLAEQPVYRGELYASAVEAENKTLFGYQAQYNPYRASFDKVSGAFRSTLDFWHLGIQFSSAPTLSSQFLECNPRKDVFAVPSEPGLLCNIASLIKSVRPLPVLGDPGYMDH